MKPNDLNGEEVLDHVLVKVRETRRRRRTVKVVSASAVLVLLAWIVSDRPAPRPDDSMVEMSPSHEVPARDTLAVVVWRNGVPNLEELGGDQLADLELDFSLDPVVAYPAESW